MGIAEKILETAVNVGNLRGIHELLKDSTDGHVMGMRAATVVALHRCLPSDELESIPQILGCSGSYVRASVGIHTDKSGRGIILRARVQAILERCGIAAKRGVETVEGKALSTQTRPKIAPNGAPKEPTAIEPKLEVSPIESKMRKGRKSVCSKEFYDLLHATAVLHFKLGNVQRVPLNRSDESAVFARQSVRLAAEKFSITKKEIAQFLGLDVNASTRLLTDAERAYRHDANFKKAADAYGALLGIQLSKSPEIAA